MSLPHGDPSGRTPPGLPPDAQRLAMPGVDLIQELNTCKLRPVVWPMTLYTAYQHLNALALLEGVSEAQGQAIIAAQSLAEQQQMLRELPFPPRVREQFQSNRQFLKLPPL